MDADVEASQIMYIVERSMAIAARVVFETDVVRFFACLDDNVRGRAFVRVVTLRVAFEMVSARQAPEEFRLHDDELVKKLVVLVRAV